MMKNKVKVWLTRDEDNRLFAYSGIPYKSRSIWTPLSDIDLMQLKSDKFPSVKWEDDEPTEAYITLDEPQPTLKQEIDWEQRRYEIAKEMLPIIYWQGMEAQKHGQSVKRKDTADCAVIFADMLIEKLMK